MEINMFYKVCTGIALCMLGVMFYDYYTSAHPTTLTCNYDKQFIIDNFQTWVKNAVSDAQLKTNKLEVVDVNGFTEYATPPKGRIEPIKGSLLYDDLKGAVVCKAAVLVDFSPINNKEDTQTTTDHTEQVSVRYQLVPTADGYISISMSGFDGMQMQEQITEFLKKHKK